MWVHPNATKHMWEETRGLTFGRRLSEELRLKGLADAVDRAVIGEWDEMQTVQGWQLIFSRPLSEGLNPVLKHARYLGGRMMIEIRQLWARMVLRWSSMRTCR